MPEIMRQVRMELERQGVILADSVRVADALRRHRIRSTGELTTIRLRLCRRKRQQIICC